MAKGWRAIDVRHLQSSVRGATDKRLFVRLQTLLFLVQGKSVKEAASLMGVSRQVVHLWRRRYWADRTADCLVEGIRSGRPRTDAALSDEMILAALALAPRTVGCRHNARTVALLSDYLNRRHATAVGSATLRRWLKAMGLRYKRPKYVYEDKEPNRAQKKGDYPQTPSLCRGRHCPDAR